jgi:hypothetical protein
VVDRALLAHKIALIRDAVARIREVLPPRVDDFHQYGALDWTRIHAIAASELDDLLSFCRTLAEKAEG